MHSPLGPGKFQTLQLFLHGNTGYSFHGNKPLQGLRMRALEQLRTKRPGWGKGSAGSPMKKHVQCWDLNNNRVVAKQNKYWRLGNYFITLFTTLLCWSMSVSWHECGGQKTTCGSSCLSSWGFWGSSSDHQAWRQAFTHWVASWWPQIWLWFASPFRY